MAKWGFGAAAAALAAPFVVGQAEAQEWYAAVSASYSDVDSMDTTIFNRLGPGTNLVAQFDPETGFGARGAVGVDAGAIRFEGEFGMSRNDFEKYHSNGPPQQNLPMTGQVKIVTAMLNGYMDFDIAGAGFVPYLGLGVGAAATDIEANGPLPTAPTGPSVALIDDDQTNLAYQAVAGFALPLGDRFWLTLQYRYFNGGNVEGTDTTGRAYRTDVSSGNVDAGIRIRF